DSRAIEAGDVFFALPGTQADGLAYARDAVARGAVAVVAERDPGDMGVPVIVAPDVRAAYAKAAIRLAGPQPDFVVGVTGTNGKTSVTSFLRQIWSFAGLPAASLGTLG